MCCHVANDISYHVCFVSSSHVTAGRGVHSAYCTLFLGHYHNYYNQVLPSTFSFGRYLNPLHVAKVIKCAGLVYCFQPLRKSMLGSYLLPYKIIHNNWSQGSINKWPVVEHIADDMRSWKVLLNCHKEQVWNVLYITWEGLRRWLYYHVMYILHFIQLLHV